MERTSEAAPSYSLQYPKTSELGAGGKLRRQPPRRPPVTPYARPQQNQSLRCRLLSKLIDPACSLIAGGATRIYSSLFSKPVARDSLPLPEPQSHVNLDEDIEENAYGEDQTCSSIFGVSKTIGTSRTTDGSMADSDCGENREGDKGDFNEEGLSEIEKLMEGKTFSRDEINCLIGIINARAVDVPKVDQESKDLILSAGGAKGPVVAQNPRRQAEEVQDGLNKAAWDLATPLPKSTLLDETGSSPVDIAKAYMASWTSEVNLGSESIILKDERPKMLDDDFASEPSVPLPSPKPSTCWPGSMVQDQRVYLTPQSQRGRFGLHDIPRTPCSRSIYSKSKSKLAHVRDEGNDFLNVSFSLLQHSQTPVHGQLRSNTVDNGHGSLGPIRRIQHKSTAETPLRGSIYSHSSLNGPFPVGNSNVSKGLFPSNKKNLEQGGTGSSSVFRSVHSDRSPEMGIPPVHPHSSQMARTILEHLERNLATPKEKSNELKIATSWKRSQSSDANAAVPKGHNDLPYLGSDSSKSREQINNGSPASWTEDGGNSFSVASPESTLGAKTVNKTTSASDLKFDSTVTMFGNNAGSSLDFGKSQDSQIKTAQKDLSKVANATVSDGLPKPSSNTLGNKPVLASISVSKPEQRWMFTSDNSGGFTFPISASSGSISSEPPTPSIMPSLSGSSLPQSKEEHRGPSFSFGSNRSTPALSFSFPSTSSASNHVDASEVTFSFGSDSSSRISFSQIGKNAICY